MKKNRTQWLPLTLVLALLVAPIQSVVAAQTMMDHHDGMSMSAMDQRMPSADSADSQMKCHGDEANTADTCAPDCGECSTCAGTAAASFSPSPVSIIPVHTPFSFFSEESRSLFLSSEFRPPRV